jgi:hypothetical protein
MNYSEIAGWKYIKLRWFVSKTKRILYLKSHLKFLSNISTFDYSRPITNQLIMRLKAIDAFTSSTFWLIHEVEDRQEKQMLFEDLFITINKAKNELIEIPIKQWFDANQLLKSELTGQEIMSAYKDSVTVLAYLRGYKEQFDTFVQNKNKIWLETISK